MKKFSVLVVLTSIVALAACGSTTKKQIKRAQINTDDARLSGYLEGIQDESCTPLCTRNPTEVKAKRVIVEDEATLVEAEGSACADMVIRTVVDYDTPVSEMTSGCTIDDAPSTITLGPELINVLEYRVDGATPVTIASGLALGDVQEKHGESATIRSVYSSESNQTLRVVERRVRVCCEGSPESALSMSMSHFPEAEGELSQGIDFLWILVE